jgi:eukaryotic translation initiation factor 2C
MVKERLSDWCTHNENRLPQKILYYRDGVSDAQLEHVKDEELPQIRAGFNAFVAERQKGPGFNAPSVKITAVVCTKRHHTRFYPKDPSDSQGRPGNCKPGTLVDRSITSPYFTDFYLQSHSGIKGTAKPAHYWVLLNEMGIDTSELQYLVRTFIPLSSTILILLPQTYNLCLSYVRATLGVSYAAPAYYADRLCERARCYLRDFFSPTTAIRRQGEDDRRDAEIREGLWKPKQSDNMTHAEKDKERAQTKEKKDRIEKKMEDDQMRRARRRLGALDGQNRRDQDYDEHAVGQVLKTMYWM